MGGTSAGNRLPSERTLRRMRRRLLRWWGVRGRDYPWRRTRDPYRVAVAELLLRRTRADTARGVYERFVGRFPDPESLAGAAPGEILRMLRPLGLRWRARNIVAISRILRKHSCPVGFFRDPRRLSSLPGVGEYVASAVACFALGRRVAVVDANTARIAARVLGLEDTGEPRRSPPVRRFLQAMAGVRRARDVNFGLIDLGAMVCVAGTPRCSVCPIEADCRKGGVTKWR